MSESSDKFSFNVSGLYPVECDTSDGHTDVKILVLISLAEQNLHRYLRKWVVQAMKTWKSAKSPCLPLTVFTLKLVALFSQEEESFRYWYYQNVFSKLYTAFRLRERILPASVKMAYTTLQCNLVQHESGRSWIKKSGRGICSRIGAWKDMVVFAYQNNTLYVRRESQKFVYTFLLYEMENKQFCQTILSSVASPIFGNSHAETRLDDNFIIYATLDLLAVIFEKTLFESIDNPIPSMMEECINLEARVKALLETCVSTRFLQLICKLFALIFIKRMKESIRNPDAVQEVTESFRIGFFYIISILLNKKNIVEIVRYNKVILIYWKKLNSLGEFKWGFEYKLEYHLLSSMLIPLFSTIPAEYSSDELIQEYLNKLFNITCHNYQRAAYNMRDVIMSNPEINLESICKSSLQMIVEIVGIIEKNEATTIFQCLCHILKSYGPEVQEVAEKASNKPYVKQWLLAGNPVIERQALLSSILDLLLVIIEKFKLRWPDCLETLCVFQNTLYIVDYTGVQPMIIVKALKVCKAAIENYMTPHLVLHVEDEFMASISGFGRTLYKKLNSPDWEIADTAFEILISMAEAAVEIFKPFQDFLLEYQFLPLALSISTSEIESYVRASAINFMAKTVRIDKIWTGVLCGEELIGKAIHLLSQDSEANVRKEAAYLLTELYTYRTWQESELVMMKNVMIAAAVSDLNWEVKVNALRYWERFLTSHLEHQGMFDKYFSPTILCSETEKLEYVEGPEIKKRINKALDKVSQQYCLGVFMKALKDESDFEVCRVAAEFLKRFKNFLIKYEMHEPFPQISHPEGDSSPEEAMDSGSQSIADDEPEKLLNLSPLVIDDILSKDDRSLLDIIHVKTIKRDIENAIEIKPETLNDLSRVTKEEFLEMVLETDFDVYIEKKRFWLMNHANSLESVIDDILVIYQQKNVNTMDCY